MLLLAINQLIRSFKWKKTRILLSTCTSTVAARCVRQTVDLASFMHFANLVLIVK